MRAIRKRLRSASTVVSLRVSADQSRRLQRRARQLGRTPSETGAMLIDEGLRRTEFAFIDFRDSVVGRQAYVLGSRLAVWQVLRLMRSFHDDAQKVAVHLGWPLAKVRAAIGYASAFAAEVEAALADATDMDLAQLQRILPQIEDLVLPLAPLAAP